MPPGGDGLVRNDEVETVSWQADDVAAELPSVLERIRKTQCRIEDVHVQSPTLQSVFLHLTGRELRE